MSGSTAPMVFVVDDDPSVRKGLRRVVQAAGYRVDVFASAREFLARPQQRIIRHERDDILGRHPQAARAEHVRGVVWGPSAIPVGGTPIPQGIPLWYPYP